MWEGIRINIELSTQVFTIGEIQQDTLEPYTALYLGNPYCSRYENNLLADFEQLKRGLELVHDLGKKAYVSTFAAPASEDLPQVLKTIEAALAGGAAAIEAHSLGVVKLINDNFPGTVVHTGGLANIYTSYGAAYLAARGVKRVAPHYELSLAEIIDLRHEAGVEVEILLHGKMPLGLTRDCFLLNLPEALPCPAACREEHWLKHGDWVLKSAGTIMLSGRDVCLLEHLPYLLGEGFRNFRIDTAFESSWYRKQAGTIYAGVLESCLAGKEPQGIPFELVSLNENGFCNGYYFGRSGREYVEGGQF